MTVTLRAAVATALVAIGLAPAVAPRAGAAEPGYRLVATWQHQARPLVAGQIDRPTGVAVLADGRIAVADTGNRVVHVLTASGAPSAVVGAGALTATAGVDASSTGAIAVADPEAERVHLFGADGAAATSWPADGVRDVAFGPNGLVYATRYVNDGGRREAAVDVYATDGSQLHAFRDAQLLLPVAVDVGPDGTVYVADYQVRHVLAFPAAGGDPSSLGGLLSPIPARATGLELGPDGALYTSTTGGEVVTWAPGRSNSWTPVGVPQLDYADVAVAADGALVLAAEDDDGFGGIVRVADPTAPTRIERIGGPPRPLGTLEAPARIAVADRVWLLDRHPRVQRWSLNGQPEAQASIPRTRDVGALNGGHVVTLDRSGVQRLDGAGAAVWRTPVPGGSGGWPSTLDAGESGIAVVDAGTGQVTVMDLAGHVVFTWPSEQAGARATVVSDVAVASNRLFLVAPAAGRVMARSLDGAARGDWSVPGSPARVAAGPGGDAFALTRDGWVWRFTADGTPLAAWEATRGGAPTDLAVDVAGRVYVLDGGGRVLVWAPDPAVDSIVPSVRPGQCWTLPDKRAAPARVPLGATVSVTLAVRGGCPSQSAAADVMLVLDKSGSMAGAKIEAAKAAVAAFVGELDPAVSQVGLVAFDSEGRLHQPLSGDGRATVRAAAGLAGEGGTNLAPAIDLAHAELASPLHRPGSTRAMLILSDGVTSSATAARQAAATARADGIALYVVGLGEDVDRAFLLEIAAEPSRVTFAPTESALAALFAQIARRIQAQVLFRTATVQDVVPYNFAFVPGSGRPAEPAVSGKTLTWTMRDVSDAGFDLGYDLLPAEIGLWPTNVRASTAFIDGLGFPGEAVFPVPRVLVYDTRARPIYLPLLQNTPCRVGRAAVVLVVDTSSSMDTPSEPGGPPKIDAARAAVRAFLDTMDLPRDRVAVVSFSSAARVEADFTGDRVALEGALAGLSRDRGTRVDLGLEAALTLVRAAAADRDNVPAIVLMSDGRPQGGSEDATRFVAEQIRQAGYPLYGVGFGADADRAFLAELAGGRDRFFYAPTAAELARIYAEVARTIRCLPTEP